MEIVAYKCRPFSVLVDEFLSHFALLYCHVVDIYISQPTGPVFFPYCSSSQRSAVVFSAHPALDE